MIVAIVAIFFFSLGFLFYLAERKFHPDIRKETPMGVCGGISIVSGFIAFIVFVFIFFICNVKVITLHTYLDRYPKDIRILENRFDTQVGIIKSNLEQFPMEENIYKNIGKNLLFLLSLPEIKSDKLIVSTIEKTLRIQDDIYNIELAKNETERKLDWHQNRLISATLFSPHYDE